jgi:two-component system nitrogen regulation sensor histidine kinase NtrY
MGMAFASALSIRLRRAAGSSLFLGVGFVLAAALTGVAVILGASPSISGPLGPASPPVMTLLVINLVLILILAAAMGWRVLRLLNAQSSDAGARLHLRFVALFAIAAVAPAVMVALFFGALVTRGVENWFSTRVQTVVENSATVARSYVAEQTNYIGNHAFQMSRDLSRATGAMAQSPVAFSHFLAQEAADNGFDAAYVIDREGRVLARAEGPNAPPFVAPPPSTVRAAASYVSVGRFPQDDLLRGLLRLGDQDAYLYIARRLDPGILNHLLDAESSVVSYREARAGRARIEAAFALSYAEMALLVLLGAVWLGMTAASSIAAPVARLVQAAGKVAAGDLTARVDSSRDPEEIAVLSRAFNSMTTDLQAQQDALRHASEDAEARSEFIEAVLLGVSAGVIGLDAEGRISAVNRQAVTLLGLPPTGNYGRTLAEAAPELEAVVDRARTIGSEAEEDVDVVRGGSETRRLRVRASPSVDGLVLTFDDITRLLAAQRNAAWKDVARRIAHEIKNPLTPIQLSAERLRRKYRKDITSDLETFDRCTETIIRQVGDIGRMVDEFSSFARMPAPKFGEVDAVELLRQAVFAQRVVDPEVTVEFAEPMAGVQLVCDSRMIAQALANVLKNAGEAVSARRQVQPQPAGRIDVTATVDGHTLTITVEDNGVGLPPRDRDRLTEPYVTTREKGTGLGLAIVKRILEEHGGVLDLTDAATQPGAKVVMTLPGVHDAQQTTSAMAEAATV